MISSRLLRSGVVCTGCAPVSETMRTLQITTNDLHGGAHRAAYRLHRALTGRGAASRMAVINKASTDPEVTQVQPFPHLPRSASRLLFKMARRLEHPVLCMDGSIFSSEKTLYSDSFPDQFPEADVVNLHWIVDMLDYAANLPTLARRSPLVWTFHDMNAFTGGCHYTAGCERFLDACGCCPQLARRGPGDRSARIFRRKAAALVRVPSDRLHIVCPSRWLADLTRRSTLFGRFDTSVIPNGLDTTEFSPVGRAKARAELGLRPDGKVVLLLTEQLDDPRKGARLMLEAVERIGDISGLQICAVGTPDAEASMPQPLFHQLGRIDDNRRLAAAYSAADVFVIPSRQDNFPNTILESMACGTPVVGFDTGGIPEMIEHGRTGYLAPVGDSQALADRLRLILGDDDKRRAMGLAGRETVLSRYTLDHQADAYLELYRTLLGSSRDTAVSVAA